MVRQFKALKKVDIFTNVFPRIFPKGQSVEIIKTKILKDNLKKMSDIEKEHVTQFFYKNSKKFHIKNLRLNKTKNNFIKLKFAIDTKRDLKNLTMYVARLTRTDRISLSKPCIECQKAIWDAGIRKVFYTDYAGELKELVFDFQLLVA